MGAPGPSGCSLRPHSTCWPWWWSTLAAWGCQDTSTTGSTSSWPCERPLWTNPKIGTNSPVSPPQGKGRLSDAPCAKPSTTQLQGHGGEGEWGERGPEMLNVETKFPWEMGSPVALLSPSPLS